MELGRMLRAWLPPPEPTTAQTEPDRLHALCLRAAAIYATTSLYEFHGKHHEAPGQRRGGGQAGDGQIVHEAMWEQVFPLLDQHFLQLVPPPLYEQFLDCVLTSLDIAAHFDACGKQLMQYIILFFPEKQIRRFRARKYVDRVLRPTVACLHKCTAIEELYLERADSPAITPYLLAHSLKFLSNLRVLALPKQCDDDVASIVGLNCPRLESIVLTGTAVTNVGLSWLLCCCNLHTVIMPGEPVTHLAHPSRQHYRSKGRSRP